jgi:membrane associated rhomboid family serine protease
MLRHMEGESPAKPEPAEPEPAEPPAPPRPSVVASVRRAPASALIIVVNVIVFVLAERAGSTTQSATLVRFGAVSRDLVWGGEYWRLATAMFLHIGVVHLLWNGYYGFRISAQVERAIGAWRFVALYLLAGVAGAAASVIGHRALSAGASGALFGLIGWQVMAQRARLGSFRALWDDPGTRRELKWIGLWFVVGVFAGFDNFAHGGGLAFGLLFAWAQLAPPPSRKRRLVVALASLAGFVLLALRPLPVVHGADGALEEAIRSTRDPAAVLALTEPLLATDRRVDALELRGYALLGVGRYLEATDAAAEVIKKRPSSVLAHATLGGARFMLGDRAGAEAEFQRAIALDRTPWARQVYQSFQRQAR